MQGEVFRCAVKSNCQRLIEKMSKSIEGSVNENK